MKRTIGLLVVLLALAPACASKNLTPETPKAAAALKVDALVLRVNELQATVMDACGPAATCANGTIQTDLARTIVQTCIDVRGVLRNVPAGWQATVRTTWATAKGKLAGVTNPAILAAVNAVDALIGAL